MKRDLVIILAYIAFLLACYELQVKYLEKSEERLLEIFQLEKKLFESVEE